MPHRRSIPSLSDLAKHEVSELVVQMLCGEKYAQSEVLGVCSILSNLGQLQPMVERVLDKLCEWEASPNVWDRALSSLLNTKTTSMKVKPGWKCGDYLLKNLANLPRLVYMDITGNPRLWCRMVLLHTMHEYLQRTIGG